MIGPSRFRRRGVRSASKIGKDEERFRLIRSPSGHDDLPLQSTCLPATAYVGMGDIGHILEHVSKKSNAPLVVVGCSIGAAHFTRWAGTNPEKLQQCRVQGA